MAGKGFCVKIRLELHAITCPGVWLCPNGEVALRITSLGSTLESHRVSPIFPLLFHNEFNFKKTFTRLAALTELQRNLEEEYLYAELIQWLRPSCNQAILLATFETNLADVLYPPVTRCERLLAGVDVDLLMDPSKYFPGIIAPKIEISTKTVIEEVTTVYDARNYPDRTSYCVVNPKTIDSKRKSSCVHRKRPAKGIIRQRSVCHSRTKAKATACSPPRYRCEPCDVPKYSCRNVPRRINECYHPMKQKVKSLNEVDERPSVCGNLHIFDSCPVCLKYKCYFACECGDIAAAKSNQNLTDFHDYEHRWCYRSRTPNDRFALHEPFSTGPQPRICYLSESKDRGRYEERSRKVTGE